MSALSIVAIVAATTLAQQPQAGYVFPPVLAPGVKSEVVLGGYDFTPDIEFRVLDARIGLEKLGPPGEFWILEPPYWFGARGRAAASPIPREVPVRIDVPADVAPGAVGWQAASANGGSLARRFLVSELPIVLESRRRADAQEIATLPAIVAARLRRNAEIDRYTFTASATTPVTVNLFARRLGSDFNATLKVTLENGRSVVDVADTEGRDVTETFLAREGVRYTIHVSDIDFRGNRAHVYALELLVGARVVATLPAAGKRGQSQDVMFVGYGLEGDPEKISRVTRRVDFPFDGTRHSFGHDLLTANGTTTATLLLSDLDESVATEPGVGEDAAQPDLHRLVVPAGVTARIDGKDDEDRYVFESLQGESWRIAVHAQTLGSAIDPHVRIIDVEGKELGKSDDVAGTVDCRLDFSAPTDGPYTVVVADRSGILRQSEMEVVTSSIYRLVVEKVQPDFSLSIPQTLNIAVGGKAEVIVRAQRMGGYAGEIDLAITGLPEGVTAPGAKISVAASEFKISLSASGDCGTELSYLQVVGIGRIGEIAVARVAEATISGNLCPRDPTRETTPRLLLTPTLASPVTISIVDRDRQRAVPRGTTYPAPIRLSRADGYEGEISLVMAAKQGRRRQGIRAPIVKVPTGTEFVEFPCFLPEWLATDRTTRMVPLAMAKVTDAKGKERYLLSKPKARITFILEGALLKVTHETGEVEARLGSAFDLFATVRRVAQFAEPATLEALFPDDVRDQFKTATTRVPLESENGSVRVEVPTNVSLVGEHEVIIRATAIRDGKWPVVSQTTVVVIVVP